MIVLGLCCCTGFSLTVASGGSSLVVGPRFLIAAASLIAEHRFWDVQASVVAACGLVSCGAWA